MDTASDKALQRFAELMIEKIKQVEDNWAKALVRDKGWGTSAKYRGKNLQRSKFLHVVSTFGKRAVQPAGLYDLHASQRQRP